MYWEAFFFSSGSTAHDWGWPKNGPFWTKNGQTWQACKHSKVVQRGPSGPFWAISNRKWLFLLKRGPKWSKTLRLTILVAFGPFWTTLERWQACHVWPFLVQNGPSPVMTGGSQFIKKAHHQVSYVWPACRTPKCPDRQLACNGELVFLGERFVRYNFLSETVLEKKSYPT